MRTTIELPDELLRQAKIRAAVDGISLKEFFIASVEQKLSVPKPKHRRELPTVGSLDGPVIRSLTSAEIEEALFGTDETLISRR